MGNKASKGDKFECEINMDELSEYGPLSWMVRPCEWYYEEYKDCTSIRGRIHQYFILGTKEDCSSWRDDYYNCAQFRKTKMKTYINKIVQSEIARKDKRIEQSRANNVWEYRTEPPSDWNRPISDD